jgi:hypothetical protein
MLDMSVAEVLLAMTQAFNSKIIALAAYGRWDYLDMTEWKCITENAIKELKCKLG